MMKNNKRCNLRVQVEGATADITDGKKIAQDCVVSNISLDGLKIVDIFKNFNYKSDKITCIISIGKKNFRLEVLPVWGKTVANDLQIGFKIKERDTKWTSEIYRLLNKNNKDVWGYTD